MNLAPTCATRAGTVLVGLPKFADRSSAERKPNAASVLNIHAAPFWPLPEPAYERAARSKNSRFSLSSSGTEASTETRLGIAIRPFSVSATSQIRCSEPVAPT